MCLESRWDKQGGDAEPRPWAARLGPGGLRLPGRDPSLGLEAPGLSQAVGLQPRLLARPSAGLGDSSSPCNGPPTRQQPQNWGSAVWGQLPWGQRAGWNAQLGAAPFSKQPGGRGSTGARTRPVRPAASAPQAGTGQDPACSSQHPFSHSCPDCTLSPAPSPPRQNWGRGAGPRPDAGGEPAHCSGPASEHKLSTDSHSYSAKGLPLSEAPGIRAPGPHAAVPGVPAAC